MSGALINLVRLNTIDEIAEHDYTSGELFERHDEITLEDPNGCPCAIPAPSAFENIDYKLPFITGSIGEQGRIIRRKLAINIDYIDNYVARKLEQWMHQRAHVLVAPNFGRNTEFSFRPVRMAGTAYLNGGTAYDLTGNHALEFHPSSGETMLLWDESNRRFLKKSVSDVMPLFGTEGGAAVGSPKIARNLMIPSYPKSATQGAAVGSSGWSKWGTDASQLTFTHLPGKFGHPDCPDVLKVDYTDDVTGARAIAVEEVFNPGHANYGGYTPAGAGDMTFCVWMRGKMPDDADIRLTGFTGRTTRDLGGVVFDGWTPVIISRHEDNWGLSVPSLAISVYSSNGVAGSFEIGPTMCIQASGSWYNPGAYWVASNAWASPNTLDTVSNFTFPSQGYVVSSFTLPEWWESGHTADVYMNIVGSSTVSIEVGRTRGGIDFIQIRDDSSGHKQSLYPAGHSALIPGKINTVIFAWNGDAQSVYVNGAHLGDVNMTTNKIDFGASVTPLRIGDGSGGVNCFPALVLTVRIDEGTIAAEDAANIHYALTDPIALQFAMNQRGRVYRITGIPQTVINSDDGSLVIGTLTLEQVDFQHWLADPLNVEEVVR